METLDVQIIGQPRGQSKANQRPITLQLVTLDLIGDFIVHVDPAVYTGVVVVPWYRGYMIEFGGLGK